MTRRGSAWVRDPERIVADLNTEWASIRDDAGDVGGWAARHTALRGCADPAAVLAAIPLDADPVLEALLRESARGSLLAARTVLQSMLGKVVLMGRSDPAAGTDAYVVAMWERIRTYPIDRRPTHIAGNLALDARKLARRGGCRDLRATPWPPGAGFAELVDRQRARDEIDHGRDVTMLTAGEVIRAALELELIDADAGALLGSVYADGLSSGEAARTLLITPQAVRQRCRTVVRRLADHSDELARTA
jgi:DNA-directed RNA polymerase specialized sigma24 family protein